MTHDIDMMLATIPSLPRALLDRLVGQLIDHLDDHDGDADIEANGDELDGSMGEDDFHHQSANREGKPGDPDDAEDDLEDCCSAGDDRICSGGGPLSQRPMSIGSDDDDEELEGVAPQDAAKSYGAHLKRIWETRCVRVDERYRTCYYLRAYPSVPTLRALRRRHPRLRKSRRSR